MMIRKGAKVADYSFSRPDLVAIKDAGYAGVIRYVGWSPQTVDTGDKIISTEEAGNIYAAGLGLALVLQIGKYGPIDGYGGGLRDGAVAIQHAQHLGYQGVLFTAVDYDTSLTDTVHDYIRAFSEVVRAAGYKSGVYGGVKIIGNVGTIVDYCWQTMAWSYGAIAPNTHIHQLHQVEFPGGIIDHNDVLQDVPFYHPTIGRIQPTNQPKGNHKMFLVQLLSQQIVVTDGLTEFRLLFDDGSEFLFMRDVLQLPIFVVKDRHVDNFYRHAVGMEMIAE